MMPSIFQNNSTAAPRSRRPRGESESRRTNGQRMDSGGRRLRENPSKNPDRRSPSSKSTSPSASIYSQPNVAHENSLTSTSSGEESPISPRSPDLHADMKAGQAVNSQPGIFQLVSEPQTPAALLQYLDTEDEDAVAEPQLTKSKTEGSSRPGTTAPPLLRPQPTTIQQYRERELSSQSVPQVKKENSMPVPRPRLATARPRPQSAYVPQYLPAQRDEHDDAPMSEPETSSKQTVLAGRPRQSIPVAATSADSGTDSTDSTSGTESTTDEEDDEDDEYHVVTPRPINHGPSLPPSQTATTQNQPIAVGAQAPPAQMAPKLERTPTIVHHHEASATDIKFHAQKQDSAWADTSKALSGIAKLSQPMNALQFLQVDNDDDDDATPTKERKEHESTVQPGRGAPSTSQMVTAKPYQSISSQYFATQKPITPPQPMKRETIDPETRLPTASVLPATAMPSTTAIPAEPSSSVQHNNALQYLEKEEKKPVPQPIQRTPSNKSARAPSVPRPPVPSVSAAYLEKTPLPNVDTEARVTNPPALIQREPSHKGVRSPSVSRPPAATVSSPHLDKHPASFVEKEKDEKPPNPQPVRRETSSKGVRSPSVSRPSLSGPAPAYFEKTPGPQPIQREPSNRSNRSQSTSRPHMPVASAAYFEKANKGSSSQHTRNSSVEPPLKSPVMPHRPLAHVFPAHHFYDTGYTVNQSPRRDSGDAPGRTHSTSRTSSPQVQYTAVRPPNDPPSAIPSRPLTPESSNLKEDQETVTGGSPYQMSMSMPILPPQSYPTDHYQQINRAYTPPVIPSAGADPSNVIQPMPMYPYGMQDPRAYYSTQYSNMQQGNPYMVEPQYSYAQPPLPPPQHQPGPFYSNSPDPYRHHRMSLVSNGGESRQTPEMIEAPQVTNQTRPATGRTSPQDESVDLLSRIQTALPDLQALLSRCEEVTGQHKEVVKQAVAAPEIDLAHQEALKQKTVRIEELEKEIQVQAKTHATERNRMRFEIGNLQEQYRDLQDELVGFQKRRTSSDQSPAQLEAFRKEVDGLRKELEASLTKQRELFEAKNAADQSIVALGAQLKALNAELDAKRVAEVNLQSKFDETLVAHQRERDALEEQGRAEQKLFEQRLMQDKSSKERYELDTAMRARDIKHEDARNTWNREREELKKAWQKEREELQKTWEKEKEELVKSHAREKDDLSSSHLKDKEELSQTHVREKDDLTKTHTREKDELYKSHTRERDDLARTHEDSLARCRADADKEARGAARRHEKALAELERGLEARFDEQCRELEGDNNRLRRDYKRVKRDWHLDRERGREEREKLRAAATRMQTEHSGLMKLLEAFAEPTERDREREEKRERRAEKEKDKDKDKEKEQQVGAKARDDGSSQQG